METEEVQLTQDSLHRLIFISFLILFILARIFCYCICAFVVSISLCLSNSLVLFIWSY